ncbi:DUF927 domain-containing protein [Acidocella sp.]|uniref:DUF927 domain-containing protein n=1 Tax=Acidocella sp. TaxID=50710 RepID=UPI0018510DD1|nr:DUF927 domain-containing protein [Acidocella sp.]NNM55856.1 DUF927 domain-containing protein [Acidocella sp.]
MNELSADGIQPDPFAPFTEAEKTSGFPDSTAAVAAFAERRAMPEIWEPQCPAPAEPPESVKHWQHGDSVARWDYRTADGAPIFSVYRFNTADGGKQTLPHTYGRRAWTDKNGLRRDATGWHWKRPLPPLPLYGLDRLAARPEDPVLIAEGEKSADAAAKLFPSYVAITSCGGSNSAGKADWTPLADRMVTIWPDHDDAGTDYARAVTRLAGEAGAAEIRIVSVPELFPPGWDVADDLPEGEGPDVLAELLAGAALAEPPFKMPDGYSWEKGQLWFQPGQKDGSWPPKVFVCGQFDVLGEARTSTGTGWSVFLRWCDRDGRRHEWPMPKSLLHREGNLIAETLTDAGLVCGIGQAHGLLKDFLARVYSARRFECVDRTGWHQAEGKPVFVAPWGKVYGEGAANIVLQSERIVSAESFKTAGTLKQWQDEVAQFAIGNDRVALFMAAGFAGPLLEVLSQDSGGLHLVGSSQSGKTTCASGAGSLWGQGTRRNGQVRSWKTTANGLEGTAAETSDCLLILDELGQADSKEVADIVYQLANETGKGRAARGGEARRRQTWRSLFLSTGELTLAAKIGEAGKRTMAGLEVRLISLPADAGAGYGVFQELHGFDNARDLATQISGAAAKYYGTAARAFLAKLTDNRAKNEGGLIADLKGLRDKFMKDYCPADADGQVKSVCSRFALIGVAGELARVYGVLPWPKNEALRAAGACFKAWLAERGGSGAGEDSAALAQVRAFLEAHGASRFERLHETNSKTGENYYPPGEIRILNRAGFSRLVGDELQFLIMPEAWRNEVCKGMNYKQVAAVLRDKGYLKESADGKNSQSIRIAGHGQMRFYVVTADIMAGDA